MEPNLDAEIADHSSDRDDRVLDFLTRHGGRGAPTEQGESQQGIKGWFEVHAADGYRLRCEWTHMGTREELSYTEIAPGKV